MKLYSLSSVCAIIGSVWAKGPGWKLDDSCKANGWQDMVPTAVESAFSMASDELDAVTRSINKAETNEDIGNVIKWMFMKDGEEPNEERLGTLKTNLQNLVSAKTRKDNETPDRKTIVVYCSLDRFEKTDSGAYYDKDIKETIKKGQSAFDHCKRKLPVVAYTWNPTDRSYPSQIQLCPWFLNWQKSVQSKALLDARFKGNFYRAVAKGMSIHRTFFTPIDMLSLLDKVILHEMQHTIIGGSAMDVDMHSLKLIKYGWKRCLGLAQEGDTDRYRQSQLNADTIAVAGNAIRYIKKNSIVKKNGEVVKKAS
ncbi:hypothetical protein N7492_008733 [Penicillium capsulatum]|uniref:Lysine-specific metallo-endopeptidase domain-containing protein n=1 Tax=Penicillium capsulatum TaxID=69766 RepID=A0A9W9HTB6_9EURO|nr:hypothetical protein N7492_008733 [Penicillium capsulatum]KAJ6106137.1 hypothetical protein N7512_009654 [Penicillium capsulatum]